MKSSIQQGQSMEMGLVQETSKSDHKKSSTMQETSINYAEFEKNYSRELLLMDCLDWIKDRPYDAKEILDHLEFCSNNKKISEEPPQMDQIL